MKNLSIKIRVLLVVLFTIAIVSSILVSQSIISITSLSQNNITAYKKDAYANKELELKNYVSVAIKSIESLECPL